MELSEKLQQITGKIERLQLKLQTLETDKEVLQAENNRLNTELQSLQNKEEVATKNILEHAQEGDKSKEEQVGKRAVLDQDIHQQIDHYLSEIDTCIEWLRQQ